MSKKNLTKLQCKLLNDKVSHHKKKDKLLTFRLKGTLSQNKKNLIYERYHLPEQAKVNIIFEVDFTFEVVYTFEDSFTFGVIFIFLVKPIFS